MRKVLIIEDDNTIAQLYKIVFTKRNYSVEIAYNGEEGISKMKDFTPDIILLDIMMPKMNGMQVIKYLKADSQTQNIPIIILSNLTEMSLEQAMLRAGALKFVVKSQHLPDQIVNIVDECFNQPPQSSSVG